MTPLSLSCTWGEAWDQVAAALDDGQSARWLVEEAAGLSGSQLWLARDQPASESGRRRLGEMLGRRLQGEPLAYVLGHWSFRGLELEVSPGVLIPRPETEWTAEQALQRLATMSGDQLAVADLGTGSGALALALAVEDPRVRVWAVERSPRAAAVARRNIERTGLGVRVQLCSGSWYEALPAELQGRLAMVVSNPPYVSLEEMAELPAEVGEWEPSESLLSGTTGLEATIEVLEGAVRWLEPNGEVVLELASQRGSESAACARRWGLDSVSVRPDLTGRPRVLLARRPQRG